MERSVSGLVRVLDCEPCDRLESQVEREGRVEEKVREEVRKEERLEVTRRSRRNSLEGLVDRVVDRVSPLEEFNTLHRHHPGVRASIKLKESDLV